SIPISGGLKYLIRRNAEKIAVRCGCAMAGPEISRPPGRSAALTNAWETFDERTDPDPGPARAARADSRPPAARTAARDPPVGELAVPQGRVAQANYLGRDARAVPQRVPRAPAAARCGCRARYRRRAGVSGPAG